MPWELVLICTRVPNGAQVIDLVEAFFTNRDRTADADAPLEHDAELEAAPAAWG